MLKNQKWLKSRLEPYDIRERPSYYFDRDTLEFEAERGDIGENARVLW
jgi:hypothetical protein